MTIYINDVFTVKKRSMMIFGIKKIILIMLLCSTYMLHAQSNGSVSSVALPSVNNQFVTSNASNNISLSNGTITPGVSLYNLSSKGLEIPVSLFYNSGRGIKVQDVSGCVGLGWKLNSGGSISRVIRGLPDEGKYGYIGTDHSGTTLNNAGTSGLTNDILNKIGTGQFDGEPDIFSVNTAFFNFQFVFDQAGNPVFPNNNGFKIVHNLYSNPDSLSTSFVLTDCSGNQYYFGSSSASREQATSTSTYSTNSSKYISTWYLDKIIMFNSRDQISFNYISGPDYSIVHYFVNSTVLQSTQNCSVSNTPIVSNNTETITFNSPKYLSAISSSLGEMDFNYVFDRRDITNAGRLNSMTVYPLNPTTLVKGSPIKTFIFSYSYFGDPTTIQDQLRLKLDNIQITGNSLYLTETYQSASFEYNMSTNLPSRQSAEFDYWGYYNINTSGTPIVPAANKNPDAIRASANILTAIHEVTGEINQYEYGLNEYLNSSGQNIQTGGLRIQKVSRKTTNGDNLSTLYSYNDPNGKSTGQINNNLFSNFQRIINVVLLGNSTACVVTGTSTSSESVFNTYDLNGNFVGYSSVKVTNPNGGYEIDKFSNFSDYPDSYASSVPNSQVYGYPNSPQLSCGTSLAYKRGLLLSKTLYNANGNPVSATINSYSSLNSTVTKALSVKTSPFTFVLGTTVSVWLYGTYFSNVEDYRLSQTIQKEYDMLNAGNFIQQITNYTYSPNNRSVHTITTTDSKGGPVSKTLYYTEDNSIPMTSYAEQGVIANMLALNNKDALIHTTDNRNGSIFQEHNYYSIYAAATSKIFRTNVSKYKSNTLVNAQTINYDVWQANGISSFSTNASPASTVYGYNATLPIAVVTNANTYYDYPSGGSALKMEFFYEGFEQGGYSGSGVQYGNAHTGRAFYDASVTPWFINYYLPNNRSYIIQWWSFAQNKWSLNEQSYTGPQSLTGIIDDIRIFPVDAKMTTYTYDPLIGMTSQCDENNRATYYEYDAFGRLALIRDNDKNIMKKICYNFSGQSEACIPGINTTAQWRATGNSRCQPCPQDNTYNSDVKEIEEKDINPNSGSTGTTRWVVDPLQHCSSPADYQPRTDLTYCEQFPYGNYTGNQITPTVDRNPCSTTYLQWGPSIIVSNPLACHNVIACVPACVDPQYKCINGVCEHGIWSVIKVTRNFSSPGYTCYWAWCFSDGSIQKDLSQPQTTTSSTACTITCY